MGLPTGAIITVVSPGIMFNCFKNLFCVVTLIFNVAFLSTVNKHMISRMRIIAMTAIITSLVN